MKDNLSENMFIVGIVTVLFCILVSCTRSQINSMTYEPIPVPTSNPTLVPILPSPSLTPTYQWVPPTPTAGQWPLGEPITFIPAPFYYSCRMTPETYCINESTSPERAIAITIFDEAGSLSLQIAVDMLQVLDNTMRNAWDCWSLETGCSDKWKALNPYHITYEDISVEMRQALAMFILSSPYNLNGHIPAWNCWATPFQEAHVEKMFYSKRQFDVIEEMVRVWLITNVVEIDQVWTNSDTYTTDFYKVWPAERLANDQTIMYFYGTREYNGHLANEAAYYSRLPNDRGYIYYTSYAHTP